MLVDSTDTQTNLEMISVSRIGDDIPQTSILSCNRMVASGRTGVVPTARIEPDHDSMRKTIWLTVLIVPAAAQSAIYEMH